MIFVFFSCFHIDRVEGLELSSKTRPPPKILRPKPVAPSDCGPEIGTVIIDSDASENRGGTRGGARGGTRGDSHGENHSAAIRTTVLLLATAGGAGLLPWAPGTFGALVGVLLFFAFSHLGLALYALTLVALTCLGIWVSDVAERIFQRSDDGRIVIDEVAGQLLTLLPLVALRGSPGAAAGSPEIAESTWWALVVTAFVLFRVLDIWKPGPIGWAERRFAGGAGVMADDVVAGGLGAVALAVAAALVAGGCAA